MGKLYEPWKKRRGAPPTSTSPAAEVDLMCASSNHYTGTSAQGPRGIAFDHMPSHGPHDANAAFSALMGILFRALWRLLTKPFRLAISLYRRARRRT